MGIYDKALAALEAYQKDGSVPALDDKEFKEQALLYGDELQDDADEAQRKMDDLVELEQAWYCKHQKQIEKEKQLERTKVPNTPDKV